MVLMLSSIKTVGVCLRLAFAARVADVRLLGFGSCGGCACRRLRFRPSVQEWHALDTRAGLGWGVAVSLSLKTGDALALVEQSVSSFESVGGGSESLSLSDTLTSDGGPSVSLSSIL